MVRYRDYLEKKVEGFKLLHKELMKSAPGSDKEKEMDFIIQMIEREIKTMDLLREDSHEKEHKDGCCSASRIGDNSQVS